MNLDPPTPPRINAGLLGWFRWFVKGYLRKHFHSLAINRQQLQNVDITTHDALVVYANHAAWWDPLTAIHLAHQLFPSYAMYAPIDAHALAKYPMFARMGFFGIEPQSTRGARYFLGMSRAILGRPATSLWVTPEGRFADVRDSTTKLMPGLTHLAWRLARELDDDQAGEDRRLGARQRVWFVPVAVEYPFWEERKPELLVWFGQPVSATSLVGKAKQQIAQELTARLRTAQRELAEASIGRDTSQFEVLGGGQSGTFFIYDWWRRLRGKLTGNPVRVEHGEKLN